MFSIVDIAILHENNKHKALSNRCDYSSCMNKQTFIMRYGDIPSEQCELSGGFNGIVSTKGNELSTYLIGSTLWAFASCYRLNAASIINLMLIIHVLSKHCGDTYDEVKSIGCWNMVSGATTLILVTEISQKIIDSIAYNYIGYIKDNKTWREAQGTSISILYEAVAYFKNSLKYRDYLADFRYEEHERKLIAVVDEATNYPIVREINGYLSAPVKYGGSEHEKITLNYISDIHLGHHVYNKEPIEPQIRRIVKALAESGQEGIFFFGGDIAADRNLCMIFCKEFMLRRQYAYYIKWKKNNSYKPALPKHEAEAEYEKQLAAMIAQKDDEIRRIKPWFKYTKKFADKNDCEMSRYISSPYFTKMHYPVFVALRLNKIKKLESKIKRFIEDKYDYLERLQIGSGEKAYIKYIIDDVFAVLGNHEMSDFDSVEEAIEFYTPMFNMLGIQLLNNSAFSNKSYVIFGGCGFAKYNSEFNASNTLNARTFTRKDEIRETDRFENVYYKALDKAKAERKPLIVLAHYPTIDWLEHDQCDAQAVYFTGHTHRNISESTEQRYVYADNQIGYKRKAIFFKTAKLGTVQNPFTDFEDGCYEITTDQYCDYYRYNGDPLLGVSSINGLVRNGGMLIMIKHSGFYGFFTQNKEKEISICFGGRIRKIPKVKSIRHLIENFDAMVSVYLTALLPFRKVQEQIAAEVQSLGLSGKVHGCIIDVDYLHHIMLNPIDGTITYYYSPTLGVIQQFGTFVGLLKHMEERDFIDGQKAVLDKYTIMLTRGSILATDSFSTSAEAGEMMKIDIKDSIYSLSARIQQLQRLFTSRVLRDWSDSFIGKDSNEVRQISDCSST